MDYTTVPRSLIYRERRSMEEFGAYEKESITRPLAEAMLRMDFIQHSDSEKRALWCMNTAFYICTMVLLEIDPRWRISKYKSIAMPKWNFRPEEFQILTLSLVGLLLSRLEEPLHLLSYKGKTRNHFVSLMLDEGEFNSTFRQLYDRLEADQYITGTIPNSTFNPRVIDKECIHDVMSDTVFNWVNFTKYWEERSIRDIVKCFGVSEDEKHNVIDMLRQSSHGFYSAGCNDRPKQVDAMLDNIDDEIHLQYNPEIDRTIVDKNGEQEELLDHKSYEKVRINQLIEENAKLREEIKQIKEYIKDPITIDDVNETLIVEEFGDSIDNDRKIVADASARVESGDSSVQQSAPKKIDESFGGNREDKLEDQKDRLMLELRGENDHLVREVNRLKLENDELHRKIEDGGNENRIGWIDWLDDVFDDRINAEKIFETISDTKYTELTIHCYWFVVFKVLSEISWIPNPKISSGRLLKWANSHFKYGWTGVSQFKFDDIDRRLKNTPISEWGENTMTTNQGIYYRKLADILNEKFVWRLPNGKIRDRDLYLKDPKNMINYGK